MSTSQNPTEIYKSAEHFCKNLKCDNSIKRKLLKLCYQLQTPGNFRSIKLIPKIISNLSIQHNLAQTDYIDVCDFLYGLNSSSEVKNKKKGIKYSLFYALIQLEKKIKRPTSSQAAIINHYISLFDSKQLDSEEFNGEIYYKDVYWIRDIINEHTATIIFSDCQGKLSNEQINEILELSNHLKNKSKKRSLERSKLTRFISIFSEDRSPGSPQKKHIKRDAIDSIIFETGINTTIEYPTTEDSGSFIELCRVPPPEGSKLSSKDDRRALQGQLNQLAARNNPMVTDMHRLPITHVAKFLLYLLPNNPELFAYNYILLTTGIEPERLAQLKFSVNKTKKLKSECSINLKTNLLSYYVVNTPNHSKNTRMQVLLPNSIIEFIKRPGAFKNIKELSSSIAKIYSDHSTGQTPTPNRISNTSVLLLQKSNLTEIEINFISGNISPSQRAQSHYYPIILERMNSELISINRRFVSQSLTKRVTDPFTIKQVQNLKIYEKAVPLGNIGSCNAVPLIKLQKTLDQIIERMISTQKSITHQTGSFSAKGICDFIQLQHLYLYIVEQLSFCSRKFGKKTNYSISLGTNKIWGSEKASSIYSVERKLIPLNRTLRRLLHVVQNSFLELKEFAEKYKYSLSSSFNSRCNPIPVIISLNQNTREIIIKPMQTRDFTRAISKFDIAPIPVTKVIKAHLFKHTIAAELMGKLPQTILDEFMTHDRDGLDFFSAWSTASPKALELLDIELDKIFKKIKISVINLEKLS